MMKKWLPLLSICCLLLAACRPAADTGTPAAETPQPSPVAEESPAVEPVPGAGDAKPEIPSLRITAIDGTEYDLEARRGKWVVVNFWATWCSPCLKEMPELSALDAMREHVEVVGLAYEEIEPEAMKAFLEKHPVVYPIAILDVYNPPADFSTPRGLPMTYLIAPDGKVARQFLGPVTAKEIETAIANNGGPAVES